MLGSVVDAEDAVQEAMLRAWKALDRFNERSSLKTWLYRIATNVCLDTLASTDRRRMCPIETTEAPVVVNDELVLRTRPREAWVEPIPTQPHSLTRTRARPKNTRSCARASISRSSPPSSIFRRASGPCFWRRRSSVGRPRRRPKTSA